MNPTSTTRPAPAPRRVLTARARIVAWMLLAVTVALAANFLIATRVLLSRVDANVTAELERQAATMRNFADQATDPASKGQKFSQIDTLFNAFLLANLPDDQETFFSVINGKPNRRSPGTPPARLDTDPAFVAQVARIAASGQPATGRWPTAAGEAQYAVLPTSVAADPRTGALVMVEFADADVQDAWATLRILAVVSVIALLAAGVVSWLVAGRVLRPVRLVRDTAAVISETDLHQRIPVSGDDDVAQLARTFNTMLDRLDSAFTSQRQFLDDTGHELRTPLTVVRGHLELMSKDDPEDRERTIELVSDELKRMSRIVDDLILLAKSQQPDFVVLREVEVADLTVDVVEKARALGPRRWTLGEVADVRIEADEQRLTQALMQLALNAVQHTHEGGRITVGSNLRGLDLLIWVRDDGVGIPADEQDLIFHRFGRASSTLRRDGSGLGLAIVRTIAEAHHGRVEVHSVEGQGATFTLMIPLERATEPEADVPEILPTTPTERARRGAAPSDTRARDARRPTTDPPSLDGESLDDDPLEVFRRPDPAPLDKADA